MAIHGKLSTSLRRSGIASSRLFVHTSLVSSRINTGISVKGQGRNSYVRGLVLPLEP